MSILDHVVYAHQQKKATVHTPTAKKSAPIEQKKTVVPVKKPVPEIPKRGEHDRFKKLPGEKEQLKQLRNQFRQEKRDAGIATNKQISNTFTNIEVLTT